MIIGIIVSWWIERQFLSNLQFFSEMLSYTTFMDDPPPDPKHQHLWEKSMDPLVLSVGELRSAGCLAGRIWRELKHTLVGFFLFIRWIPAESHKKSKVPKVSKSRAINDIRMKRDCREWIIRRLCSNLPPLFLAIIPPKLHIILVGLHVVQPAHLASNKADSSGNALYLYSYHQILRKDLCVCQDAK